MLKVQKNLSVMTAAMLVMFASPAAYAQDDKNFEGAKVGVQAGWEQREIDQIVLGAPNNVRIDDKASGITYGGFVGYDAQFDGLVVGVEADFNLGGNDLRSSIAGGGTIELDSKWTASVSGRAGVAVTPNVLAYGRVGYELNRYSISARATGNATPIATENTTSGGLIYGGGLEYAFNKNAAFRVEYRRRDQEGSLGAHQVLGGVSLRF